MKRLTSQKGTKFKKKGLLHRIPTLLEQFVSCQLEIHCAISATSLLQFTVYIIVLESSEPKQESVQISGYLQNIYNTTKLKLYISFENPKMIAITIK